MPAWLVPLAASAAGSLISSAMGNRSARRAERAYDRRTQAVRRELGRMGQTGREVSKEYLQRLQSFDPMEYATQASQAQYSLAMPEIQRQLANLRGSQVSAGRLRTGYGQDDQDRLLERNLANLNQSTVARAMQAAQMQQATNRELGAYGQDLRNMYIDATLGRERSRYEQNLANQASQRGMWGNLLSAGIQGAATMYGGG